MSDADVRRAENLLREFVGRAVISSESSEYQLTITFEAGLEFVVYSPWRVMRRGALQGGSGDGGSVTVKKVLDSLSHLKVVSTSVSISWDTRLVLEEDYILEVIPDSVQYETWQAHVKTGSVIFCSGTVTVFPPAPRADDAQALQVSVYSVGGPPLAHKTTQAAADIMQGIEGLHSVGIAPPAQTGCARTGHQESAAFDVVELNGTPLSWFTEHAQENTLLKRVQLAASKRGARESYGPAGIFQNGSEVLVPELQARFTRHLHIGLGGRRELGKDRGNGTGSNN
jgi:hypothetical protein